jgi:BirA family biotin operon repressor/biotin-[acetyl-CoA-carboxylase] ligase
LYKIPANTLFTGKNIVFVPECHSTNTLAQQLCQSGQLTDGAVVITNHQTAGRGQRGNVWQTEQGENLTFSIYYKPTFLQPLDQFNLNRCISLGLYNYLRTWVDNVSIKWPNDILIQNKKVCGILIENTIQGNRILGSIIGIGLNVNQLNFLSDRAGSIRTFTAQRHDLTEVLCEVLAHIEVAYLSLRNGSTVSLQRSYESALFGYHQIRSFRVSKEDVQGEIIGVDPFGRLQVQIANTVKAFDIKEIEFVY